jgi:hypothetical protein
MVPTNRKYPAAGRPSAPGPGFAPASLAPPGPNPYAQSLAGKPAQAPGWSANTPMPGKQNVQPAWMQPARSMFQYQAPTPQPGVFAPSNPEFKVGRPQGQQFSPPNIPQGATLGGTSPNMRAYQAALSDEIRRRQRFARPEGAEGGSSPAWVGTVPRQY